MIDFAIDCLILFSVDSKSLLISVLDYPTKAVFLIEPCLMSAWIQWTQCHARTMSKSNQNKVTKLIWGATYLSLFSLLHRVFKFFSFVSWNSIVWTILSDGSHNLKRIYFSFLGILLIILSLIKAIWWNRFASVYFELLIFLQKFSEKPFVFEHKIANWMFLMFTVKPWQKIEAWLNLEGTAAINLRLLGLSINYWCDFVEPKTHKLE